MYHVIDKSGYHLTETTDTETNYIDQEVHILHLRTQLDVESGMVQNADRSTHWESDSQDVVEELLRKEEGEKSEIG